VVFSINFCIDLLFLFNRRKTPNSIDLRLCWIKCIFGVVGLFTIISGAYFFIISASLSSSRKKTGISENKKNNSKFCQKCFSEIKNQNSMFCTTCGSRVSEKKYPAVFDENFIQVHQTENVHTIPEVTLPKKISESNYPLGKTGKAIVFQKPVEKKPLSGSMQWAGADQPIIVHGYTIQNPFTYWSDGPCLPPEASCIDITLPVGNPDTADPYTLPYWSPYSRLSPDQRARYLSWLAHGRTDDLVDIGYAFIFFYGLERRAITENKDIDEIQNEVHRLLLRYSSSKSFNQYLNQFIRYIIDGRLQDTDEQTINKFFPALDELDNYSLMTVLAWYGLNNKKVSWKLAYSIAIHSQRTKKSVIPRKAPDLFKKLFEKKFLSRHPEEIKLELLINQYHCFYQPASPTLISSNRSNSSSNLVHPTSLNVPDINSSQFNAIFSVWDDCIEELKSASNKLNKSDGQITREVYHVLPDILKKDIRHPDLQVWNNLISAKTFPEGSIVVQISDIAGLVGINERETLTTTQCNTITTTAQDIGYILVPNQKISGTAYKWKDPVAVIPINDTIPISEKFPHAALIFEMAHTVAASDESISEIEEDFLHKFVSEQFSLNTFEIECLRGLQRVLEIQPPSLSKIGKRLGKHLNPEQKIAIARFLGDIVLLDNKFVKKEEKSLKTVFKALEIDSSVSDELIKKLIIGQIPEEPATVLKPEKARTGEAIPPQAMTPVFSIDQDKLKRTKEDTLAVQWILASVFEQEENEIVGDLEPEVKIPEPLDKMDLKPEGIDLPFSPESISTLDRRYLSILNDIMKSDEISQDEFTSLARKHNLMPRAVFDEINSWSDEELGDFLLEENENRIIINFRGQPIIR
jgi:uncharacterized tellurite resistance protein B-like protein